MTGDSVTTDTEGQALDNSQMVSATDGSQVQEQDSETQGLELKQKNRLIWSPVLPAHPHRGNLFTYL